MPQNFISADREQSFLMPLSLREWLPEDHLAWTVLAAVEEMDLAAFYGAYRADGHGRAAYEPSLMVALLLYGYAQGNRSSRGIERRCREDVAYRVICANLVPDHSTIAEFRKRHEVALAGLFGEVLLLCREAGLVRVGVIAVDGTKLHASASNMANRDYEQIAKEILADAARIVRRTSSTARSAVTSCRWRSRRIRVGVSGCERPSVGWRRSASGRPSRSRELGPSGCGRRRTGCKMSYGPSSTRTPAMRRGGRGGSARTGRGGWRRERSSRMCRPRCRRGR